MLLLLAKTAYEGSYSHRSSIALRMIDPKIIRKEVDDSIPLTTGTRNLETLKGKVSSVA